jgi:hypothetical protein
MPRPVHTHDELTCEFTPRAEMLCFALNQYKRRHPSCTFADMQAWANKSLMPHNDQAMSHSATRRYYYGTHFNNTYRGQYPVTRVCVGASCPI